MRKFAPVFKRMDQYSTYSDQELAVLVKDGDHQAYAMIYDRYKYLLYAHAYKKLEDREEARDVVQEVFVSFWNKRERIDPDANLGGFLYIMLRNSILNLFAKKENRQRYHLDSMAQYYRSGYDPADHKIRSSQLSQIIDREIAALPAKMRQVFILSRRQHLSNKQIAFTLGISEATVDRQIANALKILRTRLGLFAYLAVLLNL